MNKKKITKEELQDKIRKCQNEIDMLEEDGEMLGLMESDLRRINKLVREIKKYTLLLNEK